MMRLWVFITCLVLFVSMVLCIKGGWGIGNSEAPYVVLLAYRGKWVCGGTIVADSWVLTAAQCTDPRLIGPRQILGIYEGCSDARDRHKKCKIIYFSRIYTHPKYEYDNDSDGTLHDLALLKLKTRIFSEGINHVVLRN